MGVLRLYPLTYWAFKNGFWKALYTSIQPLEVVKVASMTPSGRICYELLDFQQDFPQKVGFQPPTAPRSPRSPPGYNFEAINMFDTNSES